MGALVQRIAALQEVIQNLGYIPASMIDVFAARTVYASSIPGVVLDCNIATGAKIGGSGAPTDNAVPINAVLATATATSPVHLVIDGGAAMSVCPLIPSTGHVTIDGLGPDTGFFLLPGSNQNGLQNFANTDLARFNVSQPPGGVGSQAGRGSNVTLRNFRLNCNRGTYPNGNVNGHKDGTLTASNFVNDTPDARSPFPNTAYWLTGITLVGIDNLTIEGVWCYDSCSYSLCLFHCTNVVISGSRFECVDSSFDGNTDGIHINGGSGKLRIDGCYVKAGDDAFALNFDEGDHSSGSDVLITNCVIDALAIGRIYGLNNTTLRRVQFRGITGTVRWWGLLIGQGNSFIDTGEDTNHSVILRDFDVQITHGDGPLPPAMILVAGNAGLVDLSGFAIVDPIVAHCLIYMTSLTGTVSAFKVGNINIHRSSAGSQPVALLGGVSGTITQMAVSGWNITDIAGSSYAAVPHLITIASPCSLGRLWVADVDPTAHRGIRHEPRAGHREGRAGPRRQRLLTIEGDPTMAASKDLAVVAASNSGTGTPLSAASNAKFQAGAGSFTVGAFVKLASLPASIQAIACKWDDSLPNSEWILRWINTGHFEFVICDGTGVTIVTQSATPSVATWYLVVAYFDATFNSSAGQVGLYVNAASAATPVTPATIQNQAWPFLVGSMHGIDEAPLDGQIAMVFKYPSVLSPTLITWLYNSGVGRSPAEILAHTGLTTPDFLYGFENSGALGTDSSTELAHAHQAVHGRPDPGQRARRGRPDLGHPDGPLDGDGRLALDRNFTVTLDANAIGDGQAVTLASDAGGTTFAGTNVSGATLAIPPGQSSATFTYNRTGAGTSNLSISSIGLTISGSPIAYVASPVSSITGVSVSPPAPTVSGGQTQAFSANVTGTGSFSSAVNWTSTAGTIDSGGNFTAPFASGSPQTITVTATSTQDNTKSGTATVTVPANASTVTGVSVSPSAPSVDGGGTQAFSATVSGTNSPSQSVTWTATLGTIDGSGHFTAPASTGSAQTSTVRATSVQDSSKSGTSTVTIPAATVSAVAVSPNPATVTGGGSQNFTASVSGTHNPGQSVSWTASLGTIDSSGHFTAPAATNAIQSATITATSTLDVTKSGTATATVPALSTDGTLFADVSGFAAGLSTVGYRLYGVGGSPLGSRVSGVTERSPRSYAAVVTIPNNVACEIRWDDGAQPPTYASQYYTPAGPVNLLPTGLDSIIVEANINARQALALDLAVAVGTLSGAGTTSITINGANTNIARVTAANTDSKGNRPTITLNPPA
jgi:hypothetical protein